MAASTADNCAAERSFREIYGYKYSTEQQESSVTNKIIYPRTQAAANSGVGGAAPTGFSIMNASPSYILQTLRTVREPIVDYQEGRGVPRNEAISFVTLITSLCTHAYTAAITILVMLWNLAPLLDGFVYFARFLVDKLIDIFETRDKKEKIVKAALFGGQIIVILFIIFLIMGLIFMPVYVLTARIIGKIWGMIAW
ncbi:hypothetical protein NQ315_008473 [Exocentrus adspersus]|uniref:Uncharacterized protein n=1 Tax=Exocentrus adspersus TaxID=1586481 RepID=A0AAV8W5C9_9CUCU|nr:hypothetical protein NQ315_008473 [Exocentrus adspersus]